MPFVHLLRLLWPVLSMLVGFAGLQASVRLESYVLLALGLALVLVGILSFTRPTALRLPRRAATHAVPR